MESSLLPLSGAPPVEDVAKTWRPLRFFNLYRLGLAVLFTALATTQELPLPLGRYDPDLFQTVSAAYLLFAALALGLAERRYPGFRCQLYGQVAGDIVALTLLMHASGGVSSGMGMLLVVSVANASMITGGRTAGLFAATATVAILFQQVYAHLTIPGAEFGYPQAGMLGITLFATAALAHVLAGHAKASEALAEQRGIDLANMAQMAEFIIEHMQTGVVVVDNYQRIRLMNAAARRLLGSSEALRYLGEVSPDLAKRLARWLEGQQRLRPERLKDTGHQVIPRFMGIGKEGRAGTLIFLEDATLASRQVQQLKLAALGRLTASIAHEVRNPLGAISHAGQLLSESENLDKSDRRMTEIVLEQSQRINAIVDTILQLGRKDQSRKVVFLLRPRIESFLAEFRQIHGIGESEIHINIPPEMQVEFDPTHFAQILGNLVENAERHSRGSDAPRITLTASSSPTGRPYLEIANKGEGIPSSAKAQVFEPFFTTRRSGTGLGLYISRELADCNGAELIHVPEEQQGCRFRLYFSQPKGTASP